MSKGLVWISLDCDRRLLVSRDMSIFTLARVIYPGEGPPRPASSPQPLYKEIIIGRKSLLAIAIIATATSMSHATAFRPENGSIRASQLASLSASLFFEFRIPWPIGLAGDAGQFVVASFCDTLVLPPASKNKTDEWQRNSQIGRTHEWRTSRKI